MGWPKDVIADLEAVVAMELGLPPLQPPQEQQQVEEDWGEDFEEDIERQPAEDEQQVPEDLQGVGGPRPFARVLLRGAYTQAWRSRPMLPPDCGAVQLSWQEAYLIGHPATVETQARQVLASVYERTVKQLCTQRLARLLLVRAGEAAVRAVLAREAKAGRR